MKTTAMNTEAHNLLRALDQRPDLDRETYLALFIGSLADRLPEVGEAITREVNMLLTSSQNIRP